MLRSSTAPAYNEIPRLLVHDKWKVFVLLRRTELYYSVMLVIYLYKWERRREKKYIYIERALGSQKRGGNKEKKEEEEKEEKMEKENKGRECIFFPI